ncbi:MAG: response regulator transcription factor [Desulfobacteraceae bacterium]|jgi:DNA-binding response OmpR family regulator
MNMSISNVPGPILIVEDDQKMADLEAHYLKRENIQVLFAKDGRQAIKMIRQKKPALVILDIMLPHMDGWEVCKEIRKFSTVPIIMLSARNETIDRVMGLNLGADDYITKPFESHELIARIKAVLRRYDRNDRSPGSILHHGKLCVDLEKRSVKIGTKRIELTPHEYCLLTTLMKYPGKVFTRDELLMRIYPRCEVVVIDKVVDIHIGKLRRKIEDQPQKPKLILAVRGVGYRFAESSDEMN